MSVHIVMSIGDAFWLGVFVALGWSLGRFIASAVGALLNGFVLGVVQAISPKLAAKSIRDAAIRRRQYVVVLPDDREGGAS